MTDFQVILPFDFEVEIRRGRARSFETVTLRKEASFSIPRVGSDEIPVAAIEWFRNDDERSHPIEFRFDGEHFFKPYVSSVERRRAASDEAAFAAVFRDPALRRQSSFHEYPLALSSPEKMGNPDDENLDWESVKEVRDEKLHEVVAKHRSFIAQAFRSIDGVIYVRCEEPTLILRSNVHSPQREPESREVSGWRHRHYDDGTVRVPLMTACDPDGGVAMPWDRSVDILLPEAFREDAAKVNFDILRLSTTGALDVLAPVKGERAIRGVHALLGLQIALHGHDVIDDAYQALGRLMEIGWSPLGNAGFHNLETLHRTLVRIGSHHVQDKELSTDMDALSGAFGVAP